MSGDARAMAQQALKLWAADLHDLLRDLDPDVSERGVAALVTPDEGRLGKLQFQQALQLADTPETLDALLKQRKAQVGERQMLAEFGQILQPSQEPTGPF